MKETPTIRESQESKLEYRREETDYDIISTIERDEMIQNPENVGFNLTGDQFINPSSLKTAAEAQALVESIGADAAFEQLSTKYNHPAEELRQIYDTIVEREMSKVDKLQELLAEVPDGASFRIHPHAPNSPFSIENSRIKENGVEFFSFDPIALEQMRAVYEKVNAGEKPGELTVVMSPYTKERGCNMPSTPEEIDAYANMCLSFLSQMGLEESGGAGICLELGNETNVDMNTINPDGSKMFGIPDGFADHVDPAEYTHIYTAVASKIKEHFPNAEVAIAGTAMFDEGYLRQVIEGVLEESGDNKSLIDKISFHPYRETVTEGAPTFKDNVRIPSELSYDEQCQRMSELAAMTDAKFDIGEISFSHKHGESVDMVELHANSEHAKEHGLKSYTWPEWQIIEYE